MYTQNESSTKRVLRTHLNEELWKYSRLKELRTSHFGKEEGMNFCPLSYFKKTNMTQANSGHFQSQSRILEKLLVFKYEGWIR